MPLFYKPVQRILSQKTGKRVSITSEDGGNGHHSEGWRDDCREGFPNAK